LLFRVNGAPIRRTLSNATIRRVRSHPHTLAQCQRYLANHGWTAEIAYDTAGSAPDLAADPEPGVAAIASRLMGLLPLLPSAGHFTCLERGPNLIWPCNCCASALTLPLPVVTGLPGSSCLTLVIATVFVVLSSSTST